MCVLCAWYMYMHYMFVDSEGGGSIIEVTDVCEPSDMKAEY